MVFRFFSWFVHPESDCAFVAERSMCNEECDEAGPAYLATRAEALTLGIDSRLTIHEGFPVSHQPLKPNQHMAKLKAPVGGTGLQIENMAPQGQHVAVCLRVNDQFGVERPDFNNPQVKEIKDVTRFIFGLVGSDGKVYLVQTYEFTISGAPGSNLSKFLKGWLGQAAQMGWDYCEMLGKGALLTVQHTPSKKNPGQYYADISGIAPVPQPMLGYVPPAAHFEAMLQQLERDAAAKAPAPGAPPPLPGQPPAFRPPAPPAPPAPPQFAPPPPPPPPPPPVADTRVFYAHINGQTQEVTAQQLATCPPATPTMLKGDPAQAWKTAKDFQSAPAAPAFTPPPFTPPPAPGGADEDVPF